MKEAILKYIDSYLCEIKEVKDRYPAGWEEPWFGTF